MTLERILAQWEGELDSSIVSIPLSSIPLFGFEVFQHTSFYYFTNQTVSSSEIDLAIPRIHQKEKSIFLLLQAFHKQRTLDSEQGH